MQNAEFRMQNGPAGMSRVEQLRVMPEEELADLMVRLVDGTGELRYCRDLKQCWEDLNADREIPLERCAKCMLKWLREPGKLPPDTDDRESCGLIEEG